MGFSGWFANFFLSENVLFQILKKGVAEQRNAQNAQNKCFQYSNTSYSPLLQ
jgi:hypothetical protein